MALNQKMRTARVFLSNGTNYATSINGTNTEIQKYFQLGSYINVGSTTDDIQRIEALTIEN